MKECHSSGSQGEGIAKERVMTGHGQEAALFPGSASRQQEILPARPYHPRNKEQARTRETKGHPRSTINWFPCSQFTVDRLRF
ncbi:MAG TPA: hypothetical protein DCM24_04650 [Synergistaceae bacterium]|nr:hypothetical protein [Synergistaceae bacterium]